MTQSHSESLGVTRKLKQVLAWERAAGIRNLCPPHSHVSGSTELCCTASPALSRAAQLRVDLIDCLQHWCGCIPIACRSCRYVHGADAPFNAPDPNAAARGFCRCAGGECGGRGGCRVTVGPVERWSGTARERRGYRRVHRPVRALRRFKPVPGDSDRPMLHMPAAAHTRSDAGSGAVPCHPVGLRVR